MVSTKKANSQPIIGWLLAGKISSAREPMLLNHERHSELVMFKHRQGLSIG